VDVYSSAPELMTVGEVAERLRIGRTRVHAFIGDGSLRSLKIGSSRRVSVEALEEFVRQLEAA